MQLPDISAVSRKLTENLPEVMYETVQDAAHANRQRTEANIAYFRDNPSELDRRIAELDEEWDVTRVLQVVTSGLSLAAFWMSVSKTKLFLLVPLMLAGGALHHGLTGQSPAADLARRLGFRTKDEIEAEREALKALRGDFRDGPALA